MNDTTQQSLIESEKDTDFTLDSHYKERINFHQKMLLYYLTQEVDEELAT